MKNEENQNEEIEEEIKNDNKKENKEKKNKKLSKKQRKEEERKRKEEEKKKKIEEKKEKEKKEKEENDKDKNEEKKGNKEFENNDKNLKSNNETSNPNINKREEFIIDTSTKNLNDEDDEKKENIRELGTTSQKNEKEDDKENVNDNDDINKDENNDNIHKIIKKLKKARRGSICQELNIKEDECNYVIDKAYGILEKEESLLKISAPLYICGDIHGQYYDLLRVFDILKYPPQSTFLFLGDYVDRGKQSLECLLLLLCLKIKYPDKIFLLRGNHECEALNKMYGFFDECKRRLSIKCFKKIITLFNIMPISALINENILCMHGGLSENILCMHGGLSKDLQNIEQINKILRPTDIPNEGLLCDILWSDPNESLNEDFGSNERNISVTFSKDVVKNFLEKNNLDLICRAHQVVEEGFEFFADMKLVTIFTAPNYMGEFDNNGGILEVGEDLLCKFHVLRPNFERNGNRKRITQLVN